MMRTFEMSWMQIKALSEACRPNVDQELGPWSVDVGVDRVRFNWRGNAAGLDRWLFDRFEPLLVDLGSNPPSLQGAHEKDAWSITVDKHVVTFGEAHFPLRAVPTSLVIEAIRLVRCKESQSCGWNWHLCVALTGCDASRGISLMGLVGSDAYCEVAGGVDEYGKRHWSKPMHEGTNKL